MTEEELFGNPENLFRSRRTDSNSTGKFGVKAENQKNNYDELL